MSCLLLLGFLAAVTIGAAFRPVTSAASQTAQLITASDLDLHDGTVARFGDTYYLYGTMYGCGFHWGQANTPWCGFGVSTASNLSGPWSKPTLLFSVMSTDPFTGLSWYQECGATGKGCFNPRMVRRTWGPNDGVFMLWFNAPADYTRSGANAYYVMGCNSPTGGCGTGAGGVGSTRKPPLYICGGNGDFTIATNGANNPHIFCTNANQTLSEEQLDYWGTSGTGIGSSNLAGLTNVESPGVYRDPATGKWIMTYSDPNCGYCAGDGTSYATASSISGPWTAPANSGFSAPATGRRGLSATSCGGQPRTVFTIDGQAYQLIDFWGATNGDSTNQTRAGLGFVTLIYTPQASASGQPLPPQFAQWPCS